MRLIRWPANRDCLCRVTWSNFRRFRVCSSRRLGRSTRRLTLLLWLGPVLVLRCREWLRRPDCVRVGRVYRFCLNVLTRDARFRRRISRRVLVLVFRMRRPLTRERVIFLRLGWRCRCHRWRRRFRTLLQIRRRCHSRTRHLLICRLLGDWCFTSGGRFRFSLVRRPNT